MYCRCCCYSLLHFLNTHKEGKKALIATVHSEGSERTNRKPPTTHIYILLRVAAVKAPNIHNRRGVTGSSGRREEGRESEQQSSNMSRRMFASAVLLLLVVMMMCCGGGAVPTEASNSGNKIIFKGKDSFSDSMDDALKQSFDSFRAPSLVYVNGVVVATVEAHYTNATNQKSCVSIAARSMQSNGREWTDGTAIVFDHYDVEVDRLLSPTTLVDENYGETYALVGGYGTSTTPLTELGG
ncbi:trans-sialidase, putative, partial [Trypanosoma cruzi marinkellei]